MMNEVAHIVVKNVNYYVFKHSDKVILFKEYEPIRFLNLDDAHLTDDQTAEAARMILNGKGKNV